MFLVGIVNAVNLFFLNALIILGCSHGFAFFREAINTLMLKLEILLSVIIWSQFLFYINSFDLL